MIQTKKRNRVQAKIFDRTAHTGTQSASACIHASTEIALKQHYFCAVKIALHRNFLRITFNFASQNFDFASQTAMRYRINSSLQGIFCKQVSEAMLLFNAHSQWKRCATRSRCAEPRSEQFSSWFRCCQCTDMERMRLICQYLQQ